MKLSIIIPVFNEEKTIQKVLGRVEELKLSKIEKEVIIVEDKSTDSTPTKISEFLEKGKNGFKYLQLKKNQGKGSAVRAGIYHATGDYIIIQDADLEYNPQDIGRIVSKIKSDNDVIYGTRLNRLPHFSKEEKTPQFLTHYIGNKFLSLMTSVLYGQWITDMETCYKLFPAKIARQMQLTSRGFELEPEITAKLMKRGYSIIEVPITTTPRGYKEGKKLHTVRDGIKAFWTLLKYRLTE